MNSTSQPVLVVGATGFLGGQVVDALLARGKTVRAWSDAPATPPRWRPSA